MIPVQYTQLLRNTFGLPDGDGDNEIRFLLDHFLEFDFHARSYIVQAGQIEKYFYVVVSGVQTVYLIDDQGNKVILGFSYSGNVSGVFDSFSLNRPSQLFLEALTPSKMVGITKKSFDFFFESFPNMFRWRSDFFEKILIGRLTREAEILIMPAKERYDAFMRRCPDELKTIPQKYIASYLNMKPETFSRLRAIRD